MGRSDQYQYSRDGELRRWTNRRGQPITYAYDALHRATSKSTNTATETWAYPNDTVVVATSPVAEDTAVANRHGQLLHVSTLMAGQYYKRQYTYTPEGALDRVIPSGGGITFQERQYVWNLRRGALSDIKLGAGPATTALGQNADGQTTSLTLAGGDVITMSYTPRHAKAYRTTTAPYSGDVNRSSGLDDANRITRQILSPTEGRQYSYDGLGRLVGDSLIVSDGVPPCDPHNPPENGDPCTFDPSWQVTSGVTLTYDSAGNRTDLGGQYATGNRITAFNNCTYTTDFDGNVDSRTCSGVTTTFGWSAENRLVSITASGTTTTLDYNAAGRLVRETTDGVVRHFLWERDNLLAELDGAGTGKTAEFSYYPGRDNPHALIVGSTRYYAHRDMLGNVIALTNEQQVLRSWYEYDAWGTYVNGMDFEGFAGKDRVRFKGAMVGPLGLYYMRNRWYEPRTGRFLSEDPIGLEGGLNPYVFAGSDPVNGRDPSGLSAAVSCDGIVVIVDGVEVPCTEDLLGMVDGWLWSHYGISLGDALREGFDGAGGRGGQCRAWANPTGGAVRGCDPRYGCGGFLASRDGGSRRHIGVDYLGTPGQSVVAPTGGRVARFGFVYAGDARYRLVEIIGSNGYRVHVFYVSPSEGLLNTYVAAGDPIGTQQDLSAKWPGIPQHVEVRVWQNDRLLDPSSLIPTSCP